MAGKPQHPHAGPLVPPAYKVYLPESYQDWLKAEAARRGVYNVALLRRLAMERIDQLKGETHDDNSAGAVTE